MKLKPIQGRIVVKEVERRRTEIEKATIDTLKY